MNLTAQTLPLASITKTSFGDKTGFQVHGYYVNGSDKFATESELHAHLMGKELVASKSGKSLIISGDWTPGNHEALGKILTARSAPMEFVNLNDLI